MKRISALFVFTLGASFANATELRHGALAQDKQDPAATMASYARLANAGDAEATFRLGEMAWYGIAQPADRARGDALFAKAAAAGNAAARQALSLSAQRAAHLDDINYWTARYDGAELESGKFQCEPPAVPRRSETKQSVVAVNESYDRFAACYNGFVDNLTAVAAAQRIPDALANVMSDAELAQAYQKVSQAVASIAAKHKAVAGRVLAQHDAWAVASDPLLQIQRARFEQLVADGQRWRDAHDMAVLNRPRFAAAKE